MFLARLAEGLRKAGYSLRRTPANFEIEGVSDEMIEEFSTRARLRRVYPSTARRMADEGRRTRHRVQDLRPFWWSRLNADEQAALRQIPRQPATRWLPPTDAAAVCAQTIRTCAKRDFIFPEGSLVREALVTGMGQVDLDSVEAALKIATTSGTDERPCRFDYHDVPCFTTKALCAEESAFLRLLRESYGRRQPWLTPGHGEDGIGREMSAILSGNRDAVVGLQLDPMQFGAYRETLARLLRTTGPLNACRPAAGIATQCPDFLMGHSRWRGTVDDLLRNPASQDWSGHWWVTECRRLPSRQLADLSRRVLEAGGRLLLDDVPGWQPPTRGMDNLRWLREDAGVRVVTWRDFGPAELEALLGHSGLAPRVRVRTLRRGDIVGILVRLFHRRNARPVVGCATKDEVARWTPKIREILKKRGRLNRPVTVRRLLPCPCSAEQRKCAEFYATTPGVWVRFHEAAPGVVRQWAQCRVIGVADGDLWMAANAHGLAVSLPLDQAEKFSIYTEGKMEIARGDLLRLTEDCPGRGKPRRRGELHRVAAVDGAGNIGLTDGRTLGAGFGHFDHGYCAVWNDPPAALDHLMVTTHPCIARDWLSWLPRVRQSVRLEAPVQETIVAQLRPPLASARLARRQKKPGEGRRRRLESFCLEWGQDILRPAAEDGRVEQPRPVPETTVPPPAKPVRTHRNLAQAAALLGQKKLRQQAEPNTRGASPSGPVATTSRNTDPTIKFP